MSVNDDDMHTTDFAAWAASYSQRTNCSLAGARLVSPDMAGDAAGRFAVAAAQWGMIAVDGAEGTPDDDFSIRFPAAHADADSPADFDARTLDGKAAIDYAQAHMPVLRDLLAHLREHGVVDADGTDSVPVDLTGVRIAVCLVLEPKTAVLLRALHDAGAVVGVFADPSETDQRVADRLREEGIAVEADVRWSAEDAHQGALRLLDAIRPQIIIDDGGSFARLAAQERPALLADLIGVAEETTSGVRAFEAMQAAGALTFPVVAVNDSVLKTGFDNLHGTGESCVTTMQELLGAHAFDGARVAVVGYGPVGRGFAVRVRALGAHVAVCDIDPVAALRAVFDGFEARDLADAAAWADIVVSATGVRHTVTLDHMRRMRDGAVLSVIGGIANEIALDNVPGFTHVTGRGRTDVAVPDGPTLTLLAEGDGVNYTAGGGNPIEIMDFSFAVQASAVAYLLAHRGRLAAGVHRLPASCDRMIARVALRARGMSASHAVGDNGYSWRLTRFADTVGQSDGRRSGRSSDQPSDQPTTTDPRGAHA
ncbi:adenosylhomocysteinase [Bifidobacterium samirii]|uniref:Hydrolase n=1 Tax=Bifidobacterium samirii TaxID=2306974 RepID=A0A430FWY8_9BIFI|nr:adenosylhomocysteinase [Bifidobacterium samirii]RSX58880.1 hydrolase [Bifidobacterium samirii]